MKQVRATGTLPALYVSSKERYNNNMKKTILLLLMIASISFCYAQTDTDAPQDTPTPVQTETLKTTQKVIPEKKLAKDVSDRIRKLYKQRAQMNADKGTMSDTERAQGKAKAKQEFLEIGFPMWRLFFTLVILAGLIIGCMYGVKYFTKRFGAIESDAKINVLTKLQIDPKNYLLLVRVYEQEMLLGVGNERISLLSKFHSISNSELDDEFDDHDTPVVKNDSLTDSPDVILDIKNMNYPGDRK